MQFCLSTWTGRVQREGKRAGKEKEVWAWNRGEENSEPACATMIICCSPPRNLVATPKQAKGKAKSKRGARRKAKCSKRQSRWQKNRVQGVADCHLCRVEIVVLSRLLLFSFFLSHQTLHSIFFPNPLLLTSLTFSRARHTWTARVFSNTQGTASITTSYRDSKIVTM